MTFRNIWKLRKLTHLKLWDVEESLMASYKSFAQRQALSLVDWGFGAKLYYDCKKEDWFCKNPGGSLIKKILWTVADKIESL